MIDPAPLSRAMAAHGSRPKTCETCAPGALVVEVLVARWGRHPPAEQCDQFVYAEAGLAQDVAQGPTFHITAVVRHNNAQARAIAVLQRVMAAAGVVDEKPRRVAVHGSGGPP
jgi:hypothetical protein